MRKILIAVMAMVTMFWFTTPTHATLWDRGGGLIYDDDLYITWLQDAGLGGQRDWVNARAWADTLVYQGYSNWRLPSAYNQDGSEPDSGFVSTSEMGHMYYHNLDGLGGGPFPGSSFIDGNGNPVSFENLQSDLYWSGTEYLFGLFAWNFDFSYGRQDYSGKGPGYYAWAVRDGDVGSAPVPEPATMLLLGSGLLGLWGARKKFKK